MTELLLSLNRIFKCFMVSCALIVISTVSVHADVSINTAGNSLLASVEQAEVKQRLEKAQEVLAQLSSQNTLEHGIARLLLAKQLNIAGSTPEAIAQISQAKEILAELNEPVHLANALYMHALLLAINQHQYHSAVTELVQAVRLLEEKQASITQPNEAFNELFFNVNRRLGSLYLFLNDYPKVLKYLNKAQQLIKKVDTIKHQTELSKNLAEYYTEVGFNKLAEQYLIDNHQLASTSGDKEALAESLIRISRFYRRNGRHQLSIDYAIKAVEASRLIKNSKLHGSAYNTLAISYEESGDNNLALVHYLNVINVSTEQQNSLIVTLAQHNIGETYVRLKQYDRALKYLTLANIKFKRIGHRYYEMANNIALAQLLFDQKKYQQATSYAVKGLAAAKQHHKQDKALIAHRILAEIYQLTEQPQLAVEHHIEISSIIAKQKQQLEIKLAQQQANNNPIEMAALEQKVLALEQSKLSAAQQNSNSELQRRMLLAMTMLLFVVLSLLLIHQQRKLAANRKLLQQARQHRFSGLPQSSTMAAIDNVISNELKPFQYLVVIDIPVLTHLLKHMAVTTMTQLQTNWLLSIKNKLGSDIFHINDSTFITTLNITSTEQGLSESSQRQLTVESLLDNIIDCMPSQLSDISAFYKPINIGMIQRITFNHSNTLVSSQSVLELALLALCASQFISEKNNVSNWTYLSPKPNTHSAMFSGADRNQWLKSIELNLIDVEFSRPLKTPIPWQSFSCDTHIKRPDKIAF